MSVMYNKNFAEAARDKQKMQRIAAKKKLAEKEKEDAEKRHRSLIRKNTEAEKIAYNNTYADSLQEQINKLQKLRETIIRNRIDDPFLERVRMRAAMPTLKEILLDVCEKYSVTPDELKSKNRHKYLTIPRYEFFYRAKNETNHPQTVNGRYLNKDHSTVFYGVANYEKYLQGEYRNEMV